MKHLVLGCLVLCLGTAVVHAQSFGIGLRMGSLGPGLQVGYALSPKLNLRAGGSLLSLSNTVEADDADVAVSFTADATIGAFSGLADWHPFGNFFRISSGLFVNFHKVEGVGLPIESYFLDEKEFTPEKLGSLTLNFEYKNKLNPYLGIGIGNLTQGRRIGFLMDFGVLYMGAPQLDLEGTGMIGATANQEQEDMLNEGIKSFQWYPNVSIGLGIRL